MISVNFTNENPPKILKLYIYICIFTDSIELIMIIIKLYYLKKDVV